MSNFEDFMIEETVSKNQELDKLHGEIRDLRERLRQREAELEQRWIAVGERLPEDGISALIFVPEWEDLYLRYRVAWINYDQSPPVWVYDGHAVSGVTHWQPLPSPPKEAKCS